MLQHDFDESIDRSGTFSMKWDAYPQGVIPMWVADTDFKSPQPVIDALAKRVAHGVFGYTWGHGSFERSTKAWLSRRFGWDIDTAWVEFVPSVVTGLAMAVRALSMPGDNVVMLTPTYPPFFTVTEANGRKIASSSLVWRDGAWQVDFLDLEARLADPKSSLFLFCNPHNPCGRCFTRRELLRIGELCLRHKVSVLSDEIHADFIHQGTHIPFPALSPEMAGISAVSINPSKTFNLPDLRVASIITPGADMRAKIRKETVAAQFGRSSLSILAYDVAYTECDYYADQVREYLGKNIDYAVSYFNEKIPAIAAYKPEATYLLWLDCRELGLPQDQLVKFFIEKARVAFNSGTNFGPEGEGFMRMNLGCPLKTLKEALGRIERAVKELEKPAVQSFHSGGS